MFLYYDSIIKARTSDFERIIFFRGFTLIDKIFNKTGQLAPPQLFIHLSRLSGRSAPLLIYDAMFEHWDLLDDCSIPLKVL